MAAPVYYYGLRGLGSVEPGLRGFLPARVAQAAPVSGVAGEGGPALDQRPACPTPWVIDSRVPWVAARVIELRADRFLENWRMPHATPIPAEASWSMWRRLTESGELRYWIPDDGWHLHHFILGRESVRDCDWAAADPAVPIDIHTGVRNHRAWSWGEDDDWPPGSGRCSEEGATETFETDDGGAPQIPDAPVIVSDTILGQEHDEEETCVNTAQLTLSDQVTKGWLEGRAAVGLAASAPWAALDDIAAITPISWPGVPNQLLAGDGQPRLQILIGWESLSSDDITTVTTAGKWRAVLPKSPDIATPLGAATVRATLRRRRNRHAFLFSGSDTGGVWELQFADPIAEHLGDQQGYLAPDDPSWAAVGWQEGWWGGGTNLRCFQPDYDVSVSPTVPLIPTDPAGVQTGTGIAAIGPGFLPFFQRFKVKVIGRGGDLAGHKFVAKQTRRDGAGEIVSQTDIEVPFARVAGVWEILPIDLVVPDVSPATWASEQLEQCGIKDPAGAVLSNSATSDALRVVYKIRFGSRRAHQAPSGAWYRTKMLRHERDFGGWGGSWSYERTLGWDVSARQLAPVDDFGSSQTGARDTEPWHPDEIWDFWVYTQISSTLWRYTEPEGPYPGVAPLIAEQPNPRGEILEEQTLDLAGGPDSGGHWVTELQSQVGAAPGSAWYIEEVALLPE